MKPNTPSQPVLSRPGQTRLVVGNWALASRKEGELHIHNSDGQQVVAVLQGLLCMQVESSVSHTCMCIFLVGGGSHRVVFMNTRVLWVVIPC